MTMCILTVFNHSDTLSSCMDWSQIHLAYFRGAFFLNVLSPSFAPHPLVVHLKHHELWVRSPGGYSSVLFSVHISLGTRGRWMIPTTVRLLRSSRQSNPSTLHASLIKSDSTHFGAYAKWVPLGGMQSCSHSDTSWTRMVFGCISTRSSVRANRLLISVLYNFNI